MGPMHEEGDRWEGYAVSLPGNERKYHSWAGRCSAGCGVAIQSGR